MIQRLKLFPALMLAGVLAISFNATAQAATSTGGSDFGIINTPFSKSFSGNVTGMGSFVDDYLFSISSAAKLKGVVASFGFDDENGIQNLKVSLLSGQNVNPLVVNTFNYGATDTVIHFTDGIPSGPYKLEVTGDLIGSQNGSYGGNFNVSAVPEPKTYGMLLLGVGFLVVAARRKSNNI